MTPYEPSESEKQELAKTERIEEYGRLVTKHLFNLKPGDYRLLAGWALSWQRQLRGEFPKDQFEARMQVSQARLYDERIEKAKQENDHAFFRKLSKALKAVKNSPDGVVPVKPTLDGAVIVIEQELRREGKKPTPPMIRKQLERDLGRRISDRHWQRVQSLAQKIIRLNTDK